MFDPLQLASKLMELVVERPVLLQQLIFRSEQAPILLADMLMAPETSAVACRVIASWAFSGGAWNQDFQADANITTKRLAFEDARSEEHTSELQSLLRTSYAVICLNKQTKKQE